MKRSNKKNNKTLHDNNYSLYDNNSQYNEVK